MRLSKTQHLRRLLFLLDVVVGVGCYIGVIDLFYWIDRFTYQNWEAHITLVPLVIVCDAVFTFRAGGTLSGDISVIGGQIARSKIFSILLLLATIFLFKLGFVSRLVVVTYVVMSFLLTFGIRLFLVWWYFRGRKEHHENYQKVLLIGSGPRAQRVSVAITSSSEWGIDLIGCLDPAPGTLNYTPVDIPVLGSIDDIQLVLSRHVVDEVIVALPRALLDQIDVVAEACDEQGVCLRVMADLYDIETSRISLDVVSGIPLLSLEPVFQDEIKLITKRVFDLVVTIVSLLFLTPLLVLIAMAVRLDSDGPAFFKQERVGLHKRRFKMYKFRSMYEDAETRLKEIEHLNEAHGPIFKLTNDPRITNIGRFIRRTSIDELPQLINVLLGHMSLVGPRAMSVRDVDLFDKGIQRKRFSVKPGITCLREVSGRSRLTFDEWLELDLKYIDNWTFILDISILIRTIPVVLRGEGAV